ncbi:hypothetical protein CAC42_1517 [Sphaceloma murrayae]|uniref:Redoxin domain-containing protein n=1 Tax=Sphaceloma murrayae TaxID=2082308 RepID=A0A2K1R3A0_9PEZI|nr:hypothetical protein CAC42_1517 [Sphaceloma murrayae]
MFAIRSGAFNSPLAASVLRGASTRGFHASRPALVKVGDAVPDIELMESSPGTKVSLAKEFAAPAKGIIIGVPAAFSPSCSAKHIPGYLNSDKLKGAGKVFVISVNDAFVYAARLPQPSYPARASSFLSLVPLLQCPLVSHLPDPAPPLSIESIRLIIFKRTTTDNLSMNAWAQSLDPSAKSGIRFLADPAANFTKALDLDFDGSAIFGGARSKRYALVIEDGKVKEAHVEPDNTGVFASTAEKVLGALA